MTVQLLNPTVGVGNPVIGGTSGSILYIGSSGQLAQNNGNFNFDGTRSMGIGVGSTTFRQIYTWGGNNTDTASAIYTGGYFLNTLIPATNSNAQGYGVQGESKIAPSGSANVTATTCCGVASNTYSQGSVNTTVGDIRGFYTTAYNQGAGVLTLGTAQYLRYGIASSGGVTTMKGLYLNPFVASSGNITTHYGIHIDAPALSSTGVITTGYALVTASGAGNVGIDTIAPTALFSIKEMLLVNSSGLLTKYNNISTISNGIPSELATIDSTGLTANVGATTLYTVPASGVGMYRVSAYLVTTTAASVSSTMPNAQVVFTDNDSNTSVTLDVSPILGAAGLGQSGLLTANTVGTVFSGVGVIYVKASTTIQYQTVNYASTAAGMAYALRIKLEAL